MSEEGDDDDRAPLISYERLRRMDRKKILQQIKIFVLLGISVAASVRYYMVL